MVGCDPTGSKESMTEGRTATPSLRRHGMAVAGIAVYSAGVLVPLSHGAGQVGLLLRLGGLVLLGWAAWRRRTLTAWIFFAMLAGGELGADAPAFAISLRVFSDI